METGALLLANNVEELSEKVKEVYLNEDAALEIGEKGSRWLKENQGAVDRAFQMIESVAK